MKANFQRWLRFMVENCFISDWDIRGRRRLFFRRLPPYKGITRKMLVECPDCGGDGKETCNNPDHGFISALGFHDIGRIGCPGCGHDPDHKVINGGKCETCKGTGKIKLTEGKQ